MESNPDQHTATTDSQAALFYTDPLLGTVSETVSATTGGEEERALAEHRAAFFYRVRQALGAEALRFDPFFTVERSALVRAHDENPTDNFVDMLIFAGQEPIAIATDWRSGFNAHVVTTSVPMISEATREHIARLVQEAKTIQTNA